MPDRMVSLLILLANCWLSTVSAYIASGRDHALTSGLEAQIRDLAERVGQLETRDLQQRQEIDVLTYDFTRSKVQVGEQRIIELERQLHGDIGHLKKELRLNQRRTTLLEKILAGFQEKILAGFQYKASSAKQSDSESAAEPAPYTDDRTEQTSQKERRLTPHVGTQPDTTVAFFASLTNHVSHAGAKQIIVFDHVITNIGAAYSHTIGVFIAPVPGVYVFSVTIMSFWDQTEHYTISKNGVAVVNMYVRTEESHSSTTGHTAVLQLTHGDTVEIHSVDTDGSAHGAAYSSFSGFLLHQDHGDTLALIG